MGSKANTSGPSPKGRRRGRKFLVLGLIGLGAAAIKATRGSGSTTYAAPTPTPAPAPTPAPPAAPVETPVAVEPEPLAEPVVEVADVVEETAPEPTPATEGLHDIVEEPWADAEVTPVTEPPADSLSSFFDEIMTDTADRKLRNGQ